MHRLRHNPHNGLYVFSSQLGRHLQNQELADEEIYFYLPKEKFGSFGENAGYVKHSRFHKFYQPRTKRFDVWHLTTGISQYKPFNRKTRVVYTIHDVNFLVENPGDTKRNQRILNRMQKNVDRADQIVCISKHARDFASRHLQFGDKPVCIIYNGCAVQDYPEFTTPGYRPAKPFIFSIGLVQPRKNFHVLPPLLLKNDYELIIGGLNHFDYAKKVIDEAKRWNVEQRVKLIGPLDEENKSWYFRNCEAFVFPSIAEGFGFPPLEAMHFGKPVFISDKMSLPEIGGEAAYYFRDFDPDSIQKIFTDGMNDFKRSDKTELLKQQAALFDWNIAAKKYLEIYRNLA